MNRDNAKIRELHRRQTLQNVNAMHASAMHRRRGKRSSSSMLFTAYFHLSFSLFNFEGVHLLDIQRRALDRKNQFKDVVECVK